MFHRKAAFRVPKPLAGYKVRVVVSDASSMGFAYYVGVPWEAPAVYSINGAVGVL